MKKMLKITGALLLSFLLLAPLSAVQFSDNNGEVAFEMVTDNDNKEKKKDAKCDKKADCTKEKECDKKKEKACCDKSKDDK